MPVQLARADRPGMAFAGLLGMTISVVMAWLACALVLADAVLIANTVRAGDDAKTAHAAPARPGIERASSTPRLAPPVLLSVEIVPDAADRSSDGVVSGRSAPCAAGAPSECRSATARPDALERAH